MAISASRYTVVTGFKDVLLFYVVGCLLYVCWEILYKASWVKSHFWNWKKKKKAFVYIYILIRNALPWLWRYGLVSLHPIHHCEQKMATTWLHIQWRDSVLWNSSSTHSESFMPKRSSFRRWQLLTFLPPEEWRFFFRPHLQ